jgi:hypothetical protein
MADTIEEYLEERNKVIRTVTVDFLQGGAFNIKEGDYHAVLNFDEMLGWMAHAGFKQLPPERQNAPKLYPTDPS